MRLGEYVLSCRVVLCCVRVAASTIRRYNLSVHVEHHWRSHDQRLNGSLQRIVSLALLVVVLHVFNTLEIGLGGNGEALRSGVFVQLVSLHARNVLLAVLLL